MNWIQIQTLMPDVDWDRVAITFAINDMNSHYDMVLEVV